METTEQSRRREERRRNDTLSIDRLSGLPAEVLSHILSFLPTKAAVATSILAKRWRFLWQYVPNLDFHSDNRNTINRVLLLHQLQSINTFRLYSDDDFSGGGGEYEIETWIIAAIARNVQKLHLYCVYTKILPLRLFTCKTLVELALGNCGVIPRLSAVCLPRLKKLHLTSVLYGGDDSLPDLLSGCPVLEDLVIGYIMDDDLVCCKISSPTVKRLEVHFEFYQLESYNHDYRVEINTPALEYLNMVDRIAEHIESGDLTSLVQASFAPSNNFEKGDDSLYCASVLEFISRLSNVESLTLILSYFDVVIDSLFSAWTTSFNSLTKLELYADCHFLVKFLESAHNLQMLIFWQDSMRKKDWREPQQVPTCLLSRLKTIRLLSVGGVENEFEIVRYLLTNARVLEAMEIYFSHRLYPEEKNHMLEEIALLERGSETCELVEIV